MTNRKSFVFGILTGIIAIVLLNGLYRYASLYIRLPIGNEMTMESKIDAIYSILDMYYVDDYDKEKIVEGVYAGLVAELGDPYTTYMNQERLADFMQQTEGTYMGIGVVVSVDTRDNRIVVIAPYEGSPGALAGILPGDKFIQVNGTPVTGDMLNEAVSMMKGAAGTSVTVTVLRESDGTTFDVEIVRAQINMPTVSHKMLENDIGYLRITNFERVTFDQYNRAYNDLKSKNMKGLILDLRNNPGGLLDVVTAITDTLVAGEYIVYTENKQGEREYTYADPEQIEVPLVVLVNGNSASASEVLSGAVKDTKTGVLVGTQTFGKGLVQNLYFLPDNSGVKVTIAKYYTPAGICINGEGITPDYIVEMPEDLNIMISAISEEDDMQLQKAIEVVTKEIALR